MVVQMSTNSISFYVSIIIITFFITTIFFQQQSISGLGFFVKREAHPLFIRKPQLKRRLFRGPEKIIMSSQKTVSSKAAGTSKYFTPSQYTVDELGNKWRLCAGAAVLNSKHELLIGERIYIPNAWQAPQGGVDDFDPSVQNSQINSRKSHEKETVQQACDRELYEEMGLRVGTHVMLDPVMKKGVMDPVRYGTSGTSNNNWLLKAGYSGQEMYWTIYRCMDSRLDIDPCSICQLEGKNGEHAEFSAVKWQSVNEVVMNVWEGKRKPYEVLFLKIESEVRHQWDDMCLSLDFSGTWVRELSATNKTITCVQHWERAKEMPLSWTVTTTYCDENNQYNASSMTTYSQGECEETFEKGMSVLFGSANSDLTSLVSVPLKRHTSFLAEQDAEPTVPVALVSTIVGTGIVEEVRQYLKDDKLFVRRTSWPKMDSSQATVLEEVYVRSH